MSAERPIAKVASTRSPSNTGRMISLDALRVAIIVMVITHHAAQAYGPTGGSWPVSDPASSEWFGPFYTVNAAVGLGLLFLLAGYFVPRSLERKGPSRFMWERWARIGVPLAFFAFFVHLPVTYLAASRPPFAEFIGMLYEGGWQGLYLHLWFLGHLLLYSAAYVGFRWFADRANRPTRVFSAPGHMAIFVFVVALALVSAIVRLWYPIDDWVPLFFVLAAEPAHLPQYVALFTVGVIAYRGDWLRQIPTKVGLTWLAIGLTAAVSVYALAAADWWNPLVAVGLEAVICAGLSLGLVVLFRQLVRRPRPLLTAMASASYAAYILHFWVVIGLQFGILGLDMPAFVKFILVTVLGTVLSFGIGHLSARIPGVRVMMGTTKPHPEPLVASGVAP